MYLLFRRIIPLIPPDHAHKIAVRIGEEQEHDDEREQRQKDNLKEKVPFRHGLQSHDCDEHERAVVSYDLEYVFQPRHIIEEGEIRIDDEQSENDHEHDREYFAYNVEYLFHFFEHKILSSLNCRLWRFFSLYPVSAFLSRLLVKKFMCGDFFTNAIFLRIFARKCAKIRRKMPNFHKKVKIMPFRFGVRSVRRPVLFFRRGGIVFSRFGDGFVQIDLFPLAVGRRLRHIHALAEPVGIFALEVFRQDIHANAQQ